MLRVRVASPASLTARLLEQLSAAPGVQNLVVLREAVHRPDGDAVHFDLSESAANPVFQDLPELCVSGARSWIGEPARRGDGVTPAGR